MCKWGQMKESLDYKIKDAKGSDWLFNFKKIFFPISRLGFLLLLAGPNISFYTFKYSYMEIHPRNKQKTIKLSRSQKLEAIKFLFFYKTLGKWFIGQEVLL